jgi:hypothetical protein
LLFDDVRVVISSDSIAFLPKRLLGKQQICKIEIEESRFFMSVIVLNDDEEYFYRKRVTELWKGLEAKEN